MMSHIIWKRRVRFFGHIMNNSNLAKQIFSHVYKNMNGNQLEQGVEDMHGVGITED